MNPPAFVVAARQNNAALASFAALAAQLGQGPDQNGRTMKNSTNFFATTDLAQNFAVPGAGDEISTSIQVNLGPVQETLLIPLLGRAQETQKQNGLLRDEKAVQIVAQLDYDFSKWKGTRSLIWASLRTRIFDGYVEEFLARHPRGTVVEVGCGLNTRFERIDNGQATWVELDLPDTIALRRQFFADGPRRSMIATSVLDSGWMDTVESTGGPWIFISEAALIYLDAADAQRAISSIAARFAGAFIVFDTTSQKLVEAQAKHDAMRQLARASWFRWSCDDPREVESWGVGLSILNSKTLLDAESDLIARLPPIMRLIMRFAPFLLRSRMSGYRLNLAVVANK